MRQMCLKREAWRVRSTKLNREDGGPAPLNGLSNTGLVVAGARLTGRVTLSWLPGQPKFASLTICWAAGQLAAAPRRSTKRKKKSKDYSAQLFDDSNEEIPVYATHELIAISPIRFFVVFLVEASRASGEGPGLGWGRLLAVPSMSADHG